MQNAKFNSTFSEHSVLYYIIGALHKLLLAPNLCHQGNVALLLPLYYNNLNTLTASLPLTVPEIFTSPLAEET